MPPPDGWSLLWQSATKNAGALGYTLPTWSQLWSTATHDARALGLYPELPTWTRRPLPTDWIIVTSASVEADLPIKGVTVGESGGYLIIKKRSSSHPHILKYISLGVTSGRSPIPTSYGASYSTAEMPSGGYIEVPPALDYIGIGPGSANLKLADFEGFGLMISGAAGSLHAVNYDMERKQGEVLTSVGTAVTMFVFGLFPTIAVGYSQGMQHMVPGVGLSVMVCYFSIGDDENERVDD
jgi:hypothetical protein